MKRFPFKLIIVIIGLGLISCRQEESTLPEFPNIILCMADDQGWGDMGYMGHPVIQTPNFDAMAAEVLRFDRFYAAAPVCSPTRGSVMTGRHPNRFACFTWGRTLRPQEITIAEALKDAGYVTGHFGKWHLGSVREGSPVNPGASGFDEWFSAPNFYDNDPILSREGRAVQTQGESSRVTMDAALEFIRRHDNDGTPYFAVIWFGSPHLPHRAKEVDQIIYPDLPEPLQNFYGEITGMDRAFGDLRSALEQLNTYENTILWYCSDNGGLPNIGRTGGRGDKADIYEGGLKVPALIQWPAIIKEPRITRIPANTSDIFPSLMEIAGIKPSTERPMDGVSLLSVIRNETDTRTEAMGFWQYPGQGVSTPSAKWMLELLEAQKHGDMVGDSARLRLEDIRITPYPVDSMPGHAAWLDWPWKLHRIQDKAGQVSWELYNLENDSMEHTNQVDVHPDRVSGMKTSLSAWQASVISSMNGKDY